MPEGLMPIAIVGMSCRLPGEVSTLDDFWRLMSRARSGWSEIPKNRFNKDAFWHPNPGKQGCFNCVGGYYLDRDISAFDAPFFNITQQEALAMDPQQRQLLECTYEALENAGMPKESIAGRNMGVFVGGSFSDYHLLSLRDTDTVPMFDVTGNHQCILAGRISHYFDLRGPCFSVDTACSSSLHALHNAVQSIRAGETEQAVVASCRLNIAPDDIVSMSTSRLLSEHGNTFAFDNRAKSGFARGEGTGVVVLKPLEQAIKDNDRVWSVIVNTGINQDGRTVGMTAPNVDAQEQLIREVYAKAGISPRDTGFVEAHGTGTKVGDPIEADALHRVFSEGRTPQQPLYIGSVKANVGHLEPASGVVAVIKASLMLEKGFILPNVNFKEANEQIPFKEWNMRVPVTQRPWPKNKRFISVNNFGFGGSNAHCVLEKGPPPPPKGGSETSAIPRLFVLSANDEEAASRVANGVVVYLEQHPGVFERNLLRNLGYTLNHRRSHLAWRSAVVAAEHGALIYALNGPEARPMRAGRTPQIAFVFTGQGAQWHAMGRELITSHPVFAGSLQKADETLKRLGAEFSMLEELSRDAETTQVNKAHISQPACTAIQLALTDLLHSWGVQPSSVVGHSSGEIAAAYAAGAISHEDAVTAAYNRGQAVLQLKAQHENLKGSMLAADCGTDTVLPMIKKLRSGSCGVACENSPSSVTISGDTAAVEELAAELERESIFNRKLVVDVAYHSSHMEKVADAYLETIKQITASTSKVAFFSSLHGKRLEDTKSLDATYWVHNLTRPVLFNTALQDLCKEVKPDILVEIGPHSALEGPVKQILKTVGGNSIAYLPSLKRKSDATVSALTLAGNLFKRGLTLDFSAVNTDSQPLKPNLVTELAPYPFTAQKYWRETRPSKAFRLNPFARHDLLGTMSHYSSEMEPTWRNVLRTDDIPWLRDHRMQDLTTFPFSGFVSMALEATQQRSALRNVDFDQFYIREMKVTRPLLMEDGEGYEFIFSMRPYCEGTRSYSDKWDEFRGQSYHESRGWIEHCRGLIAADKREGSNDIHASLRNEDMDTITKARQICNNPLSMEAFYEELRTKGAGYGETLQNILGLAGCDKFHYGLGKVVIPDTAATMPEKYEAKTIINAAFLDLIFQNTFLPFGGGRGLMPCLYMPSAVRELRIDRSISSTPGDQFQTVVHGEPDLERPRPSEVELYALASPDDAEPTITVKGFEVSPIKGYGMGALDAKPLCFKTHWAPLNEEHAEDSTFVVVNGDTQDTPAEEHKSGLNGTAHHGLLDAATVILTQRPVDDPLVSALSQLLEIRTGQTPVVSTLAEADLGEKRCINLYDIDTSLLANITAESFQQIQNTVLDSSAHLWVTCGAFKNARFPHRNMAQGFCRTIRSETGKDVAILDLDPDSQLDDSLRAKLIMQAFEYLDAQDSQEPEMEFAEEDGELVVPRIVENADLNAFVQRETQDSAPPYLQEYEPRGRRLKLDIETAGALDTLFFTDDEDTLLGADEIEISVEATGVNFKDVVISMGQLASPYIGVECSGTVARVGSNVTSLAVGDRVCAMPAGAYRTYARCLATSAAKIPTSMTMEVSASIPVVYCTAYYGICDIARLEAGERILIHAAAGGVGQAAIQLAQMVGAEIFATVGSVDKKRLIMDKYGIPEDHIFYSRSTGFGPAIREATKGQGVDVVINSLAGELLRETWDCIAHFGRFIEIGKRDITSNTRLEMRPFEHNALFSSVDLTLLASERPKIMGRVLNAVMKLMEAGTVQPIDPVTVMGISEIEKAMRLLQGGKTTGKLIIAHRAGEQIKATHPRVQTEILNRNGTYILLGGTGGLGRSMAKWMVQRGAGHVVLVSRSGTNAKVGELIEQLGPLGSRISVNACDIADPDSMDKLVKECQATLPRIRGVIHGTMVLRDMLFEKMTFDDWNAVVKSKVAGAWNIHNSLADSNLDFFVLLSSVAGVIGNRGQAAYAAANTFLDALVQHRVQQGLAATVLDLPAMDDVGYLSENSERRGVVLKNLSDSTGTEAELLALLNACIGGKVSTESCASTVQLGLHIADGTQPKYNASDARFTALLKNSSAGGGAGDGSGDQAVSIRASMSAAPSYTEALDAAVRELVGKLSAVLLVPSADLDPALAVTAYGLDSLNAIELRNWIAKEFLAHLQVLELLTTDSLKGLAALVLKKSRIEFSFKLD